MEKDESFQIRSIDGSKEVTLHLYPLQLGRLMMISKRLLALDMALSGSDNDAREMWRICAEKPQEVAEIIAIATLRTKQEIDKNFRARTELLMHSPTMQPATVVQLLSWIVSQSYCEDFTRAIRLVKMLQVEISPMTPADRIAAMAGKPSGDELT